MTTFISRFDTTGTGVRLAVKDLIDMQGEPTTAGCRAVAETAQPAAADAACLAGARAAGARIVGRTNLHELALGVTGINPWFGTPVNPIDPTCVPGGSSSGAAVAVADDEADVAYGSDTGGSVRIPAACCGVAGLKTTYGRVSVEGVWPLSPSFDTIGPLARDVAGLVLGMQLLEPGFAVGPTRAVRIGRLRVEADPVIDKAIDDALSATDWEIVDVELPGWDMVTAVAGALLVAEAWQTDGALLDANPDKVGPDVAGRLRIGSQVDEATMARGNAARQDWRDELARAFATVDLIATPTLTIFPPTVESGEELLMARCTLPVNLAGVPALALPVPSGHRFPASLQLIGPLDSEPDLLAAGQVLERAAGA